jgi:hypothetical protein
VLGVGDGQPEPELRRYLADYLEVPSLFDEDDVVRRVHGWLRGRSVDRVLANWEPLVITAARLRELFGLPGMSVDTVRGFRDKQLMKERVAAAGIRVPLRRARVRSRRSARRSRRSGCRRSSSRSAAPVARTPTGSAMPASSSACCRCCGTSRRSASRSSSPARS